jgi:adenylate cyclase
MTFDERPGAGPADVRAQLRRILQSSEFDASERNRQFLTYVVEETLEGRADRIKAYNIATSVFGRDASFDPQLDSIVRIEAGRLRRSLERYYLTAGVADAMRITIPKGLYVPAFEAAGAATLPTPSAAAADAPRRDVPQQRGRAILVRPFDQDGDQSAFPNFARSFARQIIVGLTRFTDLFVFGPETALNPRPGEQAGSIAEGPSVDFILTGGTTVTMESFSVDVLLIDARSGRYVWSESFERRMLPAAIIGLRDEVANNVVRSLAQTYGVIYSEKARETDGRPPDSMTSYDWVIRFHQYWLTFDHALFREVRDGLEHAILRDPDYAEAFACLSMLYTNAVRFEHDLPPTILDPRQRALSLAHRAIELAPHSSHGYHALGLAYWFSGDVGGSLDALETGHALNPNDTDIMADLGLRHAVLMQWDKAVPLLEGSYARNPAQPGTYRVGLALWHYMHARYAAALAEAKRAEPRHVVHGFIVLAMASVQLGLKADAEAAVRAILAIDPGYGDHIRTDLQARNLHPTLIDAVLEAMREAGLAGAEIGGAARPQPLLDAPSRLQRPRVMRASAGQPA